MSEQTTRTDKWNESMCGVWRIDTTEQLREAFEVKANEIGMVLDCHFFESGNNYTDDDTRLAYSLFEAGWQAATAQAVPVGYVVVPVEPTEYMIEAGMDGFEFPLDGGSFGYSDMAEAYKAMIKAAQEQNQ